MALISASGALDACQYMSGRPNQRSNKPLTCAGQSNHRAGKYMEMNATERPSITAVLQTWLMLMLFTTLSVRFVVVGLCCAIRLFAIYGFGTPREADMEKF